MRCSGLRGGSGGGIASLALGLAKFSCVVVILSTGARREGGGGV